MSIILDIIVVAIILFSILISAKKGFVRTLVSAVGFVLAIILAFSFSGPVSSTICQKYVKPAIEEKAASILSDAAGDSLSEATQSLWEGLPDFVVNVAASAGVTEESLGQSIVKSTATTAQGVATDITNKLFIPIIENIIKAISTIVIFLILMLVVSLLSRILNKLFSGAIFGKFNRLLGGVLGAVKGAVFAVIFCLIISSFVGLSENGFLSITSESIDSTYVFSGILDMISFK